MAKKKEEAKVKVSLSIIDIQETAFKYNTEYDYSKLSKDVLGLELNGDLNPNMNDNILGVKTSLSYVDIRDKTILVELVILIKFSISNLSKLIEIKNDALEVMDDNFVLSLFNISIGTLRGVLYSRLKGTPLEDYPLPAIPADSLNEFFLKTPSKKITPQK